MHCDVCKQERPVADLAVINGVHVCEGCEPYVKETCVMKRFLWFSYTSYYPCGADEDYLSDFDTIEEIKAHIKDANERDSGYVKLSDVQTVYMYEHNVVLDIQTGKWETL